MALIIIISALALFAIGADGVASAHELSADDPNF